MICSVEGCTKEAERVGMCFMHYARKRRHGDPNHFTPKTKEINSGKCQKCENPARIKGLCLYHYKQQHYLKDKGRTELLPRPSQGWWINVATGYVMVKVDGKLTYEHIILAEKALGKKLPPGAIVHHMNEKPWDNYTPYNLVICPNQAYHRLLHRRMKELAS